MPAPGQPAVEKGGDSHFVGGVQAGRSAVARSPCRIGETEAAESLVVGGLEVEPCARPQSRVPYGTASRAG